MASDALLFYAFAAVSVIGSLLVVLQKNPVYSVLAIIGSFFGLAGLYVLLEAPFVAVVQIIIYAGAIMVLFLFVVMLLNVPREDAAEWDRSHPLYRPMAVRVGAVLAVLLALQLGWALSRTSGLAGTVGEDTVAVSSVAELGRVLFTDYMFAFEVTSILIIASMVGAVVLARKRDD
ncbi:MAG TPA: NADH-quinone oxidoreductase subunit J [Vicinamibacterales bacterium]|nr:NADH-quinone oxidoreductase subunit J [Vicinamibacterales bacterium]